MNEQTVLARQFNQIWPWMPLLLSVSDMLLVGFGHELIASMSKMSEVSRFFILEAKICQAHPDGICQRGVSFLLIAKVPEIQALVFITQTN